MSEFDDIKTAYDTFAASGDWGTVTYGLIYTCNAGWLDLGHLNPHSTRPMIGAANLWAAIRAEGLPAFRDNQRGFLVRFRMDHGGIPGRPGVERHYVVKFGLTDGQKRSAALSIFMDVSIHFEGFQGYAFWKDSNFSQEDLVSNLIGFYIAVGAMTKAEAIRIAHPVSRTTAEAMWHRHGAVGATKNRTFRPHILETGRDDPILQQCIDECAGQPRAFPSQFQTIPPAGNTVVNLLGGAKNPVSGHATFPL